MWMFAWNCTAVILQWEELADITPCPFCTPITVVVGGAAGGRKKGTVHENDAELRVCVCVPEAMCERFASHHGGAQLEEHQHHHLQDRHEGLSPHKSSLLVSCN